MPGLFAKYIIPTPLSYEEVWEELSGLNRHDFEQNPVRYQGCVLTFSWFVALVFHGAVGVTLENIPFFIEAKGDDVFAYGWIDTGKVINVRRPDSVYPG